MTIAKRQSKRATFAHNRHAFLFELHGTNGKKTTMKTMAKVRNARKPVDIVLTAEHVQKSIRMKGVGNTAKCSMAVCAADHADSFPHKVEGHIDWQYSRAFIVTKVKNGLPVECVAYDHKDSVAKFQDSKDGQRRLLANLKQNGPMTIRLLPIRGRSKKGRRGTGRLPSGVRSPLKKLKGAKLRYAVAELGGVPLA